MALTLLQVKTAKAANSAALQPLDDKAPSLPFAVTFEKVPDGEDGPYVLKLKNVSNDSISASAKVYPSVSIHSDTRVKNLPERVIESGKVWAIPGLAATDKVTIEAKGFAPLNITVP